MEKLTLGCSGGPRGSHEPGIVLLDETSKVVFSYEEERFNRYKSSISCFPTTAIKAAIKKCDLNPSHIVDAVFPGATYKDMHSRWPLYLKHNFNIKAQTKAYHHQLCHAATAYFNSGFSKSLIICLDGLGDRASGLIAIGEDYRIKPIRFFRENESIGFLWAYLCQLIGYDGLEDAYKTMGLASYGKPKYDISEIASYSNGSIILNPLLFKPKGEFISKHPSEPIYNENMPSFMKNKKIRCSNEPLEDFHADIAASAQSWLNHNLMQLFSYYQKCTGMTSLCYAGGVALNSSFNGHLGDSDVFQKIYIPPCAGDSGLALGAAQIHWALKNKTQPTCINSPFQGRSYSEDEVNDFLKSVNVSSTEYTSREIAQLLKEKFVIAIFSGRSEIGPRALGNRSIIASPCEKSMQDQVNKRIKYRESYRPFAPIVLKEHYDKYFENSACNLNYMTAVVKAKSLTAIKAPAIVHTDHSSRVQICDPSTAIYDILIEFNRLTDCPILLNTSFNLKGEPNVESPSDAIRTFFSSGLDYLIIGKQLISKHQLRP